MMFPFAKTIIAVLVLTGIGAGAVLYWGGDDPPAPLDRLSELVYSRVADRVAEDVDIPLGEPVVVFPRIAGDRRDAMRDRIKERLRDRGLDVLTPASEAPAWFATEKEDESTTEAVKKWFGDLFGGDETEDIPVALTAQMRVTNTDERLHIAMNWLELDRVQNGIVDRGDAESEVKKSWFSGDYQKVRILDASKLGRFGIWLLVLMLPAIAATPFVRKGLTSDSNLTNALMVSGLAIPGALAGWVLTAYGTGFVGGFLTFLALVASVAFAFLYCTFWEARR